MPVIKCVLTDDNWKTGFIYFSLVENNPFVVKNVNCFAKKYETWKYLNIFIKCITTKKFSQSENAINQYKKYYTLK